MFRSPRFTLALGAMVGVLVTSGVLFAQTKPTTSSSSSSTDGQFEVVETADSTWMLNKATGQVWRLSFTDVGGHKYWYGMYAPMEPASSFEEFRARFRKNVGTGN